MCHRTGYDESSQPPLQFCPVAYYGFATNNPLFPQNIFSYTSTVKDACKAADRTHPPSNVSYNSYRYNVFYYYYKFFENYVLTVIVNV